jgi:hypothetical protein
MACAIIFLTLTGDACKCKLLSTGWLLAPSGNNLSRGFSHFLDTYRGMASIKFEPTAR